MQSFKDKFSSIYEKDYELWKKILEEYSRIAPVKSKVMAHYWNPTNFNNRNDLVLPIEISDPKLFPH